MTRPYRKYPWENLAIGESFTVTGVDQTAMRVAATYNGRRLNKYFTVNMIKRKGKPIKYRITRLPLRDKPKQRIHPWPQDIGESFTLPPGTRWPLQKAWQAGNRLKRKFKVTTKTERNKPLYIVTRVA